MRARRTSQLCHREHQLALSLVLATLVLLPTEGLEAAATGVDYDIVYVRQPRFGDDQTTLWPEVINPAELDPGADLVLLHPDGREEVLVACSDDAGGDGKCAVTDPFVSFDGAWVYYSLFPDMTDLVRIDFTAGSLPKRGADIFRIHVATRRIEQLTFGEFTPNTGAGRWNPENPVNPSGRYNRLGYGILNLGPCPVPGGKIGFTSNRNGFQPQRRWTATTMQLYVMDEDGSNVTAIGPMTMSSALHPTILQDGRMLFSSHEDQGLRGRRLWATWSIYPDGRHWEPVVSAFEKAQAIHFMTQLSDGDLVVVDYYNINNSGFGSLYRLPAAAPEGEPAFHSAFSRDNPPIEHTLGSRRGRKKGKLGNFRMAFTPRGMRSITPLTHQKDRAAPLRDDDAPFSDTYGKYTHPSGAPDNDLLVVWSNGPVSEKGRPQNTPYYDSGIYVIRDGEPVRALDEMILVKNDPAYNEAWPRALVSYSAVHGMEEPDEIPWLPNDGSVHPALPAGTPYGLVGSSSLYKRETFPGHGDKAYGGLDAFYSSKSSNWDFQGAEAGKYTDADIWAVRLLIMEPNSHRNGGPHAGKHFSSVADERLRILGEIPVRKGRGDDQPLDAEGQPDTSFLAKIPADTPFTFQTIDRRGLVLNMSQTWHQVRPGEMRADCGGCHAHSQKPLPFEGTAAAQPDYEVVDLTGDTVPLVVPDRDADGDPELEWRRMPDGEGAYNVEFYRDIRPILERRCVSCHTEHADEPPGRLVLDDRKLRGHHNDVEVPGDFWRLAADKDADSGYPPVAGKRWTRHNASRFVRHLQSRRSLLTWIVFGERLDGWANDDHPTETSPGDPDTLPPGARAKLADLNCCPEVPEHRLPTEEAMTIARWIDLGAPIDSADGKDRPFGWFLDDLRPTLEVALPRPGLNDGALTEIRIAAADAYRGLDPASLSVTASFAVDGIAAGRELADRLQSAGDGIWVLPLETPLEALRDATLTVSVRDRQGNRTDLVRRFDVAAGTPAR